MVAPGRQKVSVWEAGTQGRCKGKHIASTLPTGPSPQFSHITLLKEHFSSVLLGSENVESVVRQGWLHTSKYMLVCGLSVCTSMCGEVRSQCWVVSSSVMFWDRVSHWLTGSPRGLPFSPRSTGVTEMYCHIWLLPVTGIWIHVLMFSWQGLYNWAILPVKQIWFLGVEINGEMEMRGYACLSFWEMTSESLKWPAWYKCLVGGLGPDHRAYVKHVIHAGPGAMLGTKASHISDRSIWPTMHGNWGPH